MVSAIAKVIEYAERNNVPTIAVLVGGAIYGISWLSKRGGAKAVSIVTNVLGAAEMMLESMQKRLESVQEQLEEERQQSALWRQRAIQAEKERDDARSHLSACREACRECRRKLNELLPPV